MRIFSAFGLFAVVVYGGDVSGRYSGTISGNRPDGPAAEEPFAIVLVQRESKLDALAGSNLDRLEPLPDASAEGGTIRLTAPFGGGIIFELRIDGDRLTGTIRPKPGVGPQPFQLVSLKRVGDLTLSDRVPRIPWESADRSPRLLAVRNEIATNPGALTAFWTEVTKSGAPLIEPVGSGERSYLVTFLWRGAPDTRSVLVMWPRKAQTRPDDWFMSRVDGADLWFRTVKVQRGTRIHYQISPNDPWEVRPSGTWQRMAQADPLNPKRDSEDPKRPLTRVRSLLELPGALPQPYYVKRADVGRLTMQEHTVRSDHLKGERKVRIYTPPGYSPTAPPYPSLYYTDGEDSDGYVFATWTVENLIADKRIPPLVIVRIVNPNQPTRNRNLPAIVNSFRTSTTSSFPMFGKTTMSRPIQK